MGQLWPHTGCCLAFWRACSGAWAAWGVCFVCGTHIAGCARRGLSPGHTDRGWLGPWAPGPLGRHSRGEQGSNSPRAAPSASPGTRAQAQSGGLERNRNHCSCPSFWMGNTPCFLGKGANPYPRDSGPWGSGGRGAPGACSGQGKRAHSASERRLKAQKLLANSGENAGRTSPGSQATRLFPPENGPR